MIWPFKPRLPLSLLQKVIVEKCVEAAVRAPGLNLSALPEPVPPDALDPIFESVDVQELPARLLQFFQTRMPAEVSAEAARPAVLHSRGARGRPECMAAQRARECTAINHHECCVSAVP